MNATRIGWSIAALAISSLQVWDAGGFAAGSSVTMLVAAAILAPIVAIAVKPTHRVEYGAIVCSLVLLTIARIVSPIALNPLHLAAVFPAAVLIGRRALKQRGGTGEPISRSAS